MGRADKKILGALTLFGAIDTNDHLPALEWSANCPGRYQAVRTDVFADIPRAWKKHAPFACRCVRVRAAFECVATCSGVIRSPAFGRASALVFVLRDIQRVENRPALHALPLR